MREAFKDAEGHRTQSETGVSFYSRRGGNENMAVINNETLTRQWKEKISEVNVCYRTKEQASEKYDAYKRDEGADPEILDDLHSKKVMAEEEFIRVKMLLADFIIDHQKQIRIADDATGEETEERLVDQIDDYVSSELM